MKEETLYKCDLCGVITDEIYIEIETGLQLCPDCYFADDGLDDEEEDSDDDGDY